MENFIKNYGAILLTFIIQSVGFIIYIVKANSRHDGNYNLLNKQLETHIEQDKKDMKDLKEVFNSENNIIYEKLDKMDSKLNELCNKFERLTGFLERDKEVKIC